jgi:hypothetical protein
MGMRVVFLALLPLAPMALAMVLRPLTRIEAEPVPAASSARAGVTLLLAAGVALFIAGLQANSIPWIVVLVIAGAALSWPALYRILPAGTLLFRSGLPAALAMRGLLMFAYCEALAFFPLALEMVRGLSATTAGVALSMGSIGWTSGSWTQAACDYRFGSGARPRIMLFGLLILAIGIGGAASTVVGSDPLGVAIFAWGLAGVGMGICYNTSTVLSIQAETGHSAGTVSSSMQLTDSLGQTLGAGFGGAAMTLAAWASWGTSAGIGAAFALSVVVCAIGMALTPRLRSVMPRASVAVSQ